MTEEELAEARAYWYAQFRLEMWAENYAARDALVLAAREHGHTLTSIANVSGLARTTIERIIKNHG